MITLKVLLIESKIVSPLVAAYCLYVRKIRIFRKFYHEKLQKKSLNAKKINKFGNVNFLPRAPSR